jgi:hypothetical protein
LTLAALDSRHRVSRDLDERETRHSTLLRNLESARCNAIQSDCDKPAAAALDGRLLAAFSVCKQ